MCKLIQACAGSCMCGRMPHQAETVDDIFFKWTHGEEKLKTFMNNFNNYRSNLKFTYEYSKSEIKLFRPQS